MSGEGFDALSRTENFVSSPFAPSNGKLGEPDRHNGSALYDQIISQYDPHESKGAQPDWMSDVRAQMQTESTSRSDMNSLDSRESKMKSEVPAYIYILMGAAAGGLSGAYTPPPWHDLSANTKKISDFAASLDSKLVGVQAECFKEKLLTKQKALLGDPVWLSDKNMIKQSIGTAGEVLDGRRLFFEGSEEAKILQERVQVLSEKSAFRLTKLSADGPGPGGPGGPGPWRSALSKNVMKALGISTASVAAGYASDSFLSSSCGYSAKMNSDIRLLLDGVAIPSALLAPIPGRFKVLGAGVAYSGARLAAFLKF